jgi:hypothetical protein
MMGYMPLLAAPHRPGTAPRRAAWLAALAGCVALASCVGRREADERGRLEQATQLRSGTRLTTHVES